MTRAFGYTSGEDDGYLRLREAIIRGVLAPNQRLVETDMSATFAMPRAAVRTALVRLEHEGLVEREPHRGARVRLVTEAEAVEILQTRAALEGLAARRAALNVTAEGAAEMWEVLERQKAALGRHDLLGASDVNAELHAMIVDLSAHTTTQRLIRVLHSQMVRFQFRTILVPGRPPQSHAEHVEIVDAIAGGDADRAEQAMRTHLDRVAQALEASWVDAGRGAFAT